MLFCNKFSIIIVRKYVNVDENMMTFYDEIAMTVSTVPFRLNLRESKSKLNPGFTFGIYFGFTPGLLV